MVAQMQHASRLHRALPANMQHRLFHYAFANISHTHCRPHPHHHACCKHTLHLAKILASTFSCWGSSRLPYNQTSKVYLIGCSTSAVCSLPAESTWLAQLPCTHETHALMPRMHRMLHTRIHSTTTG